MHNITTPMESIDVQQLLSVSGGCGKPCCPPAPPLPQAQQAGQAGQEDGPVSVVNSITIRNANGTTTRTQ